MTPTYTATLPAAQVVVRNARNADEARDLLAMLGLVVDGVLVPDDVRHYDCEEASPVKSVSAIGGAA